MQSFNITLPIYFTLFYKIMSILLKYLLEWKFPSKEITVSFIIAIKIVVCNVDRHENYLLFFLTGLFPSMYLAFASPDIVLTTKI